MSDAHDRIYADPRDQLVDFAFDEQVAQVFPDMIRRSVPGYADVVALLGLFAERYAQPDSQIYDLGCSLGAATLALRRRVGAPGCRIVAIDNAAAMVERCRAHVAADLAPAPVEVLQADLREVEIERASLVVLNFTLQFVPKAERLALLQRIHAGLLPGGVLVLAEKITFDDPGNQAFQEQMHLAFKRANGYSDLEISQKRSALDKVLLPETLESHAERLRAAGFVRSEVWFRCFNFAAMVGFR